MLAKKMYINGELVGNEKEHSVICPADLKEIGTVAWADQNTTKQALESAEKSFYSWSNTPVDERIDWMMKLRDEVIKNENHLRECIHLEMGKPWSGTQEDFDSLKNSLQFYSEAILKRKSEIIPDSEGLHSHTIVDEPVGVVGAIVAWNFPLLNLAFKIGPAMAAGCPIVIKPSFKAPISAYAVGELCHKIGLPKGAVNIICGDDNIVGDTLTSSPIPSMLTLIGSINTGRHIMKMGSSTIKRYSMELGGNAPVIIYDDANLEEAANIVTAVKFGNAGQICVTPNRVYVENSVKNKVIELMLEKAKNINLGHDKNRDVGMGPLIDKIALERVQRLVDDALNKGAKLIHGGSQPNNLDLKGYFFEPTILDNLDKSMSIYSEEIFGPVISVYGFDKNEDIITEANNTDSGLTAYVFTKDKKKQKIAAKDLRFGEVQINGIRYNIDLPHIGIRQSGIGCDCSHLALNDYLIPKRVTEALKLVS